MACPFIGSEGACPYGATHQLLCGLRWRLWLRCTLLRRQPETACGECLRRRLRQLQEQPVSIQNTEPGTSDPASPAPLPFDIKQEKAS